MSHEFSAPLSRGVWMTTLFSLVLVCAMPVLGMRFGPHQWLAWRLFTVALPLFAVPMSILYMVRGYRISAKEIEIERFGWSTRLPLAGLSDVSVDSRALVGARRRWGNGGCFAITGAFTNHRHGRMRVWATDPARTVALKYADHTVILTPDDPARFVHELRQIAQLSVDSNAGADASGR